MNGRGSRRAEGGKEEGQVECFLLVMSWIGYEGSIPGWWITSSACLLGSQIPSQVHVYQSSPIRSDSSYSS